MNPDQQIRAAAAQAAATLMAPIQPLPADYVAVAEVVEAFIRDGKEAAFALCPPAEETAPVQQSPAPQPEVTSEAPAPRPEPEDVRPEPEPAGQDAEVIPLAARGSVAPKQEGARRIVEDTRRKRAEKIFAEAKMAKVKAHKERLLDEASEAGLSDYPLPIDGKTITLGAYLASL